MFRNYEGEQKVLSMVKISQRILRDSRKYVNDGIKLFSFVLKNVYGNKSIDEYENELIRAANGIEDSGYIGSMQKTIAENAGQLIVVGGYSSFQRSMVMSFRAKNQDCQDCVIYICYY